MHERRQRPDNPFGGEVPGDFTDWDNPEDEEDAPEGYYDGEEDADGEWYVPDESDPDYDLSEAAGYAGWEAPRREVVVPHWVFVFVSLLLLIAILTPLLFQLT